MNLIIAAVMLVLFAIFFSANYFFYATLVKFFRLRQPVFKRLIFIVIYFLSFSFIAASVLARFYDNLFVGWYYGLSAAWIGALFYLAISSGLVWFLYLLSGRNIFSLPWPKVTAVMLAAAVLVTFYGLINAGRLDEKFYEIELKNRPENWRGKTIAHISDLHLGVIHGPGYVSSIVERLNRIEPAAVFITGDYFDGTCACFDELAEPLRELKAPAGVYFVTGNHETYTDLDAALQAVAASGVIILRDEIKEIDGLTIIGADYPARGMSRDLAPLLRQVDPAGANIFLYHEPRYIEEVKKSGIGLFLAGHTHAGQLWPIRYIDRLLYGRYYYGLHGEGDFSLYTTSGAGTWGPPLRVGTRSEIAVFYLK